MTLQLDHVQIAIPVGGESTARSFYGGVLGLDELPKPANLAARGGCWFALGHTQLHMGTEKDFRPARKAHIAFTVDDLCGLRARVEQTGAPVLPDEPLDGRARFFSEDPFGNRIEFLETPRPDGESAA